MSRFWVRLIRPLTVAILAGLGAASAAQAQELPSGPLRIIVSTAQGGNSDFLGRILSNHMGQTLNRPIIIENRPGGGGTIAMQELSRSAPDGATMILLNPSEWAIYPALRPGAYDPVNDLAPVGLIMTTAMYVVVQDSFPAKTLDEFVAYIKANPGKLSYGSIGNGSIHHLAMELWKTPLGLDIVHVPYRSSSQSVPALLAGDIQMTMSGLTAVKPHLQAGKVRLMGSTLGRPNRGAPSVPSLASAGVPGYEIDASAGLFSRAGTPKPIIEKLNAALNKALNDPEVIARFDSVGSEALPTTPERLGEIVREDIKRYGEGVRISGAKLE
jgi:tripartite-type tricarboxylate transporter receptor subunit TctC